MAAAMTGRGRQGWLTQGLLGNGTCQSDDLVRNAVGAALGTALGIAVATIYGTPSETGDSG